MSAGGARVHKALNVACETAICVVIGRALTAELVPEKRPLTLAAAASGRVRYQFGARDLWVDDDTFLVVNGGHLQRVWIDSPPATELTQMFFPDGLLQDVHRNSISDAESLLANPIVPATDGIALLEGLTRHAPRLSPALRYVQHCVRTADVTREWLEEQAHYLLDLLLAMQTCRQRQLQRLDCVRRATRVELYRRAALAADCIDSNYSQDFGLSELATVACLSKFHLLRLFKQIYGVTPQSYKEQRRVLAARRLMQGAALSMSEIAERVGYSSRTSLRTQMERWGLSTKLATI